MSQTLKWALLGVGVAAVLLLVLDFRLLEFLPSGVWVLTALAVGMAAGAAKLYQRWSGTAATPGVSALSFGLVANGIAVGLTMLTFLPAPAGGEGRPMGLTFFYFVFALVMTPIGIAKAARAWSQEESLAISAMILSLGIFPIEILTLFTLAAATAFYLSP